MLLVDEQSLSSVARRVKEKLSGESYLSSPPHVVELEDIEEPHILLCKRLIWQKDPSIQDFNEAHNDPQIAMLLPICLQSSPTNTLHWNQVNQ